MKKTLLATVAACLASLSLYGDIDGKYSVSGSDPYNKGRLYTGSVTISKDQNGVYQASWVLLESGKEFRDIGTGIKTGDQVSFAFKNTPGQADEYQGLQIYTIKGDTLEGPFVFIGKNLVGAEKLIKVP